jgi:hypothetical protein
MTDATSVEQIEQAKPYRTDGRREKEHADDAQRLLRRLRDRGAEGITTGELIREGCCGLRPPNRIGDLRDAGHLIETRREGHGVFRFVLIRECANPTPKRQPKKAKQASLPQSEDWFTRSTGRPRPANPQPNFGPLFSSVGDNRQ